MGSHHFCDFDGVGGGLASRAGVMTERVRAGTVSNLPGLEAVQYRLQDMCSDCGFEAKEFGLWATCSDARDDLFAYTWTLPRPPFLHQLATDAYSAQHLREEMSPIAKLFPLMGLYLVVELGASGYEVQLAHQSKSLDKARRDWPDIPVRPDRFRTHVGHVISRSTEDRERAILEWVTDTWAAFAYVHEAVRDFCR